MEIAITEIAISDNQKMEIAITDIAITEIDITRKWKLL